MSTFGNTGCTILAWVNPSSDRIPGCGGTSSSDGNNIDDRARIDTIKELLQDAAILWGTRWSIDFTWHTSDSVLYIYGICGRLTIGVQTFERALGDLANHVHFYRGGPHDSWEQLVRYRNCIRKWNVPDAVTESTSGDGNQERPSSTFWGAGKKRR